MLNEIINERSKMNRRFLKIKNFKNIGIDEYQYLDLNNTLEPYKMGELIIVVGEIM